MIPLGRSKSFYISLMYMLAMSIAIQIVVESTTGKKIYYMMQTTLYDAHDAYDSTEDTCDAMIL